MEVAMERASWMMGGAEPKMARAQGRRPETARARGRRPRSEFVVESDGIARVVGDRIGHFFAAGRGGDVRHDLGGGVHLTVRYHV